MEHRDPKTQRHREEKKRFFFLDQKFLFFSVSLCLWASVLFFPLSTTSAALDAKAILAQDPSAGKLLDVPFIAQKSYACGPASVAMVLRYHGVSADADAIAARFFTTALEGTFTVDLLIAASDAGMEAHWVSADLATLRAEIDAGRPAVVFVNLALNPIPQRHFAVAVGYLTYRGKDYLVLHSGANAYQMEPEAKFAREWKRTANNMMTVRPAGATPAPPPSPERAGPPKKK
jgi:hypothetical protein